MAPGKLARALRLGAGAAAAVALTAVSTGHAQQASDTFGKTTVEQTLRGEPPAAGSFPTLAAAPGEPYAVREDGVGTARPAREQRRRSLLYFAQLTDFQLSDEESPARVEFFDTSADEPLNSPFGAAWRPQEAFVAHMTDQSIRQVNAFAAASPVTQGDGARARMGFAITTGDSADSQQRNETEAVLELLEGGRVVTNSGSSNPADYAQCPGPPPPIEDQPRYTGVQDYDDGVPGTAFYDPDQPTGQFAAFPRYPGLMDRAQAPFQTPGLAVPSYVTFGNHDALVQGNQAANASFEEIATSCVKVFAPVPGFDDASVLAAAPTLLGTTPEVKTVPPDPNRQYVSKPQYKQLHRAGGAANAHGFDFIDPEEEQASGGNAGYYAWDPAPGFRFVALDTVSEGGVAGVSDKGNLDDPQFRWLQEELAAAQRAGKLIVLFGHHPIRSMSSGVPDEVAPPCTARDEHEHDVNPGCDLDPRNSTPIHQGADLEALLEATPNVIALISGHTHENRANAVARDGGGGFWAIETAAEIDFPHQNRLLEIMDNRDGTLSIFGTVLDNAAPVAAPAPGTDASAFDVAQIASIGRQVGYNDPQSASASASEEVGAGGLGRTQDRNVELLLRDPRSGGGQSAQPAPTATATPTATPTPRPRRRDRRDEPADPAPRERTRESGSDGGDGGSLPFTGLALGGIAAAGGGLLALGLALRRRRDC